MVWDKGESSKGPGPSNSKKRSRIRWEEYDDLDDWRTVIAGKSEDDYVREEANQKFEDSNNDMQFLENSDYDPEEEEEQEPIEEVEEEEEEEPIEVEEEEEEEPIEEVEEEEEEEPIEEEEWVGEEEVEIEEEIQEPDERELSGPEVSSESDSETERQVRSILRTWKD